MAALLTDLYVSADAHPDQDTIAASLLETQTVNDQTTLFVIPARFTLLPMQLLQ